MGEGGEGGMESTKTRDLAVHILFPPLDPPVLEPNLHLTHKDQFTPVYRVQSRVERSGRAGRTQHRAGGGPAGQMGAVGRRQGALAGHTTLLWSYGPLHSIQLSSITLNSLPSTRVINIAERK